MNKRISEKNQNLYDDLSKQGYNLFNENDSFYQDICASYKSQIGKDALFSDWKNDYYNPNETICQANCHYSAYLSDDQYLKCECGVTSEDIDTEEPKNIQEKFYSQVFNMYWNTQILENWNAIN